VKGGKSLSGIDLKEENSRKGTKIRWVYKFSTLKRKNVTVFFKNLGIFLGK